MVDSIRVGIGYDIHRLAEGRRLIVGGIKIPHDKGLVGHSDADVVLHAVTDALLGAAGLPDIGDLFPDTDPDYKDADSRALLSDAMQRVRERGFRAGNLDVIIHAETPKMSPYKRRISEVIAELTGLPVERVSVKAKTNEGMGPLGHTDAIASTVIASVIEKQVPAKKKKCQDDFFQRGLGKSRHNHNGLRPLRLRRRISLEKSS